MLHEASLFYGPIKKSNVPFNLLLLVPEYITLRIAAITLTKGRSIVKHLLYGYISYL